MVADQFDWECSTTLCILHDFSVYFVFRCIIVAIVGAVGNLLTLLAIPWAQRKKLPGFNIAPSKYTTIFIVNLAFADFLYCVINLPMYSRMVGIFNIYQDLTPSLHILVHLNEEVAWTRTYMFCFRCFCLFQCVCSLGVSWFCGI